MRSALGSANSWRTALILRLPSEMLIRLCSSKRMLRAVQLPPVGGDTCWASMYAAYEALSPHMQRFVDQLTAEHDFARPLESAMRAGYQPPTTLAEVRAKNPPVQHPVARTHPVTGRKGIYVNGNYTTRICQLHEAESNDVLAILFNAPLKDIANPNQTPEVAKAPWYFAGLQELLSHLQPMVAGVLVPTAAIRSLPKLIRPGRATHGSIWDSPPVRPRSASASG